MGNFLKRHFAKAAFKAAFVGTTFGAVNQSWEFGLAAGVGVAAGDYIWEGIKELKNRGGKHPNSAPSPDDNITPI